MWDLHRLSLLRDLAQHGTITAVAQARRYSPSSVSAQLAKLQDEVGVELFVPDGRRVRLTPHGERLAGHAGEVIDLQERLEIELAASPAARETIRIAILETAARTLLPRALDLLADRAPQVRIEAQVLPPEVGLAELEVRGFDIAMAEQYPGHARTVRTSLRRETLGLDPIRIAVARDTPVESLADLREAAWVMEPVGTAARYWAEQQCRAAGFEPDVRFVSADLQVHIHLVLAGHAVSVLPDLVWSTPPEGIRLLDFPEPAHRELFTAVRETSAARPTLALVRSAFIEAFGEARQGPRGGGQHLAVPSV